MLTPAVGRGAPFINAQLWVGSRNPCRNKGLRVRAWLARKLNLRIAGSKLWSCKSPPRTRKHLPWFMERLTPNGY